MSELESQTPGSPALPRSAAAAAEGFLVADERRIVRFADAGACIMFGRLSDALAGARLADLLPDGDSADGRRSAVAISRPDGPPVLAEVTLSPFATAHGTFLAVSLADIAAAGERGDWFRLAVEAAPTGILLVDGAGRVVHANSQVERTFGYARSEVIGRDLEFLLPERFRQAHAAHQAGYLREAEPRPMGRGRDLLGLHKDGREIPVEIGLTPLRGGGETFVLASIADISERKKMEERLVQAQKLESLGVLASGIAHDFNNLLTGILGFADLALLESPQPSALRRDIEKVIAGARSAAELTQQMLAYAGKSRFDMQPLKLVELVEEMSELLRVSISKNCVLQHHFEADLPEVVGDSAQIRQVILNLIVNASEAIGERGGTIAISAGALVCDAAYLADFQPPGGLSEGRYVYLEVSDTGCGMTDEVRSRIFDPFFTTKAKGRGLGLSASLGIVRSHRGGMKIYSEPGRGTTFKVLLPAQGQPARVGATGEAERLEWKGTGTVLVADDEEAVRSLAEAMLARMGFDVVLAGDGQEALETYAREPGRFRLVILDMSMPRLNGVQAFRELRRVRGDVRVVLSTGHSEQTAMAQFAGKGLAGFVAKPYGYEDLLRVVRRALGGPMFEARSGT